MINRHWYDLVADGITAICDYIEKNYSDNAVIANDEIDYIYDAVFTHSTRYNTYVDAVDMTERVGVWECIKLVKMYERKSYNAVYTVLSDAQSVAETVWYIVGRCIMFSILYCYEYTKEELYI